MAAVAVIVGRGTISSVAPPTCIAEFVEPTFAALFADATMAVLLRPTLAALFAVGLLDEM